MTQEEKAKAYDEALERARKIHNEILNNEILGFPDQIREIFPQLRESEDERIRKWIASYIHHGVFTEDEHPMALKAVEWLEKQKERQDNPNAHESFWSGLNTISSQDKDKNLDEIAQDYVDGVMEYNPEPTWDLMQTAVCYGYHYREQKEQKPAERFEEAREKYQVEWSEEDESKMGVIIRLVEQNSGWPYRAIKEYVNWLKSLRPSWKPSEEQMGSLRDTIVQTKGYSYSMYLPELYEQLKKLM